MAFTEYYVDPDVVGGLGDGSSWTNAASDLQTLENAVDADIRGGNSVRFNLKSSGGSAETTPVTFGGWDTDSDSYILVQGGYAAGETGTPGTPENPTEYSTSYWHIEIQDTNAFRIEEDYFYVDKVLFKVTQTGANNASGLLTTATTATNNYFLITNCIFQGVCSGTAQGRGINIADGDEIVDMANCISYGFFISGDTGFSGFAFAGTTWRVVNCLAYGNYYGFSRANGTVNIYNSVSFNNTDDFNGTMTLHKCASDDNDAENVAQSSADDSAWGSDFTDSASYDFSLVLGSNLIGAGDADPVGTGLGATSINGATRGAAWDIGPWEYVAAGASATPVPVYLQQYRRRWSEI